MSEQTEDTNNEIMALTFINTLKVFKNLLNCGSLSCLTAELKETTQNNLKEPSE